VLGHRHRGGRENRFERRGRERRSRGRDRGGTPARIILDEQDKPARKGGELGFSAYAVTSKAGDDPLAKAVQGCSISSVEMDKRIELILKQIEDFQTEREDKQLRLGPKVVTIVD